jgi:hypothetical protein
MQRKQPHRIARTKRTGTAPKATLSDQPTIHDGRFLSSFMDLEIEVHDLDRMGEIADCLVMGWIEQSGSEPLCQAELAVCAVQQLRKLLAEFKTKYCRAWKNDTTAVQS